MKKFIIPAVVLVILIIPSVLYLGITTGKHNFGNLPYFGPRQAHDTTDTKGRTKVDTAYYKVPAFEFTNQDGKPYSTTNLDGKVYVANFIATTNTDTTKKMSVLMQEVQKKIKGDYRIKAEDFRIISFSANPEADSLPALKTYSKRLMADSMLWNFVTGNKADINTLATKGYLLANKQDLTAPGSTFVCGKFVLVDKERHIRGIYDGTNIEQVNRMVEDIKVLFANYRIPRKGTDNGSPKVEQRH